MRNQLIALLLIGFPFVMMWLITRSWIMVLLTPVFYMLLLNLSAKTQSDRFQVIMAIPLLALMGLIDRFKCPLGCGINAKGECLCI